MGTYSIVLMVFMAVSLGCPMMGVATASPCAAQNTSDLCQRAYLSGDYECGWRTVSQTCMDCSTIQDVTTCATAQQSACNWNVGTKSCVSYGYACATFTTAACGTVKGQRSGNRCVWNSSTSSCGRCVQHSNKTCPWPICGVTSPTTGPSGCDTPENHCESLLTTESECRSESGVSMFNCYWDSSLSTCFWCGIYPNASWCATNEQCYWSAGDSVCIASIHDPNATTTTTTIAPPMTATTTTTSTTSTTTTSPPTTAALPPVPTPSTNLVVPSATTVASPGSTATAAPPNATANAHPPANSGHVSWPLVGGVISGAAALIGVFVAFWCCFSRRHRSGSSMKNGNGGRLANLKNENQLSEEGVEIGAESGDDIVDDEDEEFDGIQIGSDGFPLPPEMRSSSPSRKAAIRIRRKKKGIATKQLDNKQQQDSFHAIEDADSAEYSNSTPNSQLKQQQQQHHRGGRTQQPHYGNSSTGTNITAHRQTPLTTSDEGQRSSATTAGSDTATMFEKPQQHHVQPQTWQQTTPRRPPRSPAAIIVSAPSTSVASPTSAFVNIPELYLRGHVPRVRIVGRGGSGTVFQCRLPTGDFIALKEIFAPQASLVTGGVLSYSSSERSATSAASDTGLSSSLERLEALQRSPVIGPLLREVRIVESTSHPHIVKHYGFVLEPDQRRLVLFSEFLPLGSLASMVKSLEEPMLEFTARGIAAQLTSALAYLHARGVVHRDVKCDNVLLAGDGIVKLSDFGASRMVDAATVVDKSSHGAMTMVGTPCFMAPEVMLGGHMPTSSGSHQQQSGGAGANVDDDDVVGYGRRADVWSLGITILELLECGRMPWPDHLLTSPAAVLVHISDPHSMPIIPDRLSDAGREFISLCCVRDPLKRATCDELLAHPWLCLNNPLSSALHRGAHVA